MTRLQLVYESAKSALTYTEIPIYFNVVINALHLACLQAVPVDWDTPRVKLTGY